jgi:hypothetical protein
MVELIVSLTVERLAQDQKDLGEMKAHLGIFFPIMKEIRTTIQNADGSVGSEPSFETQVITRWGPKSDNTTLCIYYDNTTLYMLRPRTR